MLGLTVPQRQSFYGAPTLAARLGLGAITGPLIMQACATSVACVHAAAAGGEGVRLVVVTDRTSNGPHVVYPSAGAPGGTPASENWVLDSFGCDPNTGEGMLATAERVAAQGGFSKAEVDAVTARRWNQYEDALPTTAPSSGAGWCRSRPAPSASRSRSTPTGASVPRRSRRSKRCPRSRRTASCPTAHRRIRPTAARG